MRKIFLMRHPQVENPKKLCYGQSEIALASNWILESNDLELITSLDVTVISSPSKRCESLAKLINRPTYFDKNLMELDFGSWENIAWDQIPRVDIDFWAADYLGRRPNNKAESYLDLMKRVDNCFSYWTNQIPRENLLFITHAGPIRALISITHKLKLKQSFQLNIGYSSLLDLGERDLVSNLI